MGCSHSVAPDQPVTATIPIDDDTNPAQFKVRSNRVQPAEVATTNASASVASRASASGPEVLEPVPGTMCILSISDARKKLRVSVTALTREAHRGSGQDAALITRPPRRMSSVDGEPGPLRKDISIGRGKLVAKALAHTPTDVAGMSLKTLLSDPALSKLFVRFALYRSCNRRKCVCGASRQRAIVVHFRLFCDST